MSNTHLCSKVIARRTQEREGFPDEDDTSQCVKNCFTEMCSGSEEGSYSRLIDCVYHSTLDLRVMKKKTWSGSISAQGSGPTLDIKP